jgi:hypothetical protein
VQHSTAKGDVERQLRDGTRATADQNSKSKSSSKSSKDVFPKYKGGLPADVQGPVAGSPAVALSCSRWVWVGATARCAPPRPPAQRVSLLHLLQRSKYTPQSRELHTMPPAGAQIMENDEECEDDWYEAEGP